MTVDQWSYQFGYALGYAFSLTFCIALPLIVLATVAVLVYRHWRQSSSMSK